MPEDIDCKDLGREFGYSPRHGNGSRKASLEAAIKAHGAGWAKEKLRELQKEGRFRHELNIDSNWVESHG